MSSASWIEQCYARYSEEKDPKALQETSIHLVSFLLVPLGKRYVSHKGPGFGASLQRPELRCIWTPEAKNDYGVGRYQNDARVLTVMNDQTVQALIDMLERMLKHAGMQTLEDAGAAIQRLAEVLNQLRPLCNRERLTEALKQIETSPEDEALIRGMTESFPAITIALLQEALPLMRKEFPVVNSGRPKSLTSEQQTAACKYVGKLYAEGLDIRTAKQRTAQKFHVSVSTIERTWAERKKGHKPSVKEILDMLKAKKGNKTKVLQP